MRPCLPACLPGLSCRCDFTPIYEWHMAERERKKALPKEVGGVGGWAGGAAGAGAAGLQGLASLPCCVLQQASGGAGCSLAVLLVPPAVLQEKERLKREKDEVEAKYKYAMVDGRQETVSS